MPSSYSKKAIGTRGFNLARSKKSSQYSTGTIIRRTSLRFNWPPRLTENCAMIRRNWSNFAQLLQFPVSNFGSCCITRISAIRHPLHRDDVIRRLKTHIPDYEKGTAGSYATTQEHIHIASERARKLSERSTAFNDTEPYTDIAQLVAVLNALTCSSVRP